MVRMIGKSFYRQDAKSAKKNKIEVKPLRISMLCISFIGSLGVLGVLAVKRSSRLGG
jgi:hypothetical protein